LTPIADRPVAVLDANVLFPFRMRDILLRFHHAGLFQARWTGRILDEWTRSLLDWKPHLERSIRSQRHAMDKHFADALVTGHEKLVGTLDLPDPDDRHILATAIRRGARCTFTDNLADFPEDILDGFDIEAIAGDAFLSQIVERRASEAVAVLCTLRRLYRNPPFTPSEFILDLSAKGLPRLAALAERHRGLL